MSQITVRSMMECMEEPDAEVEVMVGYDRPLREFFATVRSIDAVMECHYSGSGMDAEALVNDLIEETGVEIPTDLVVDLMNRREGNVMHTLVGRNGVWNTITLIG